MVLDDLHVNKAMEVGSGGGRAKRIHRTAEEKRWIVDLTLAPGAWIARVARENGISANQIFQWRRDTTVVDRRRVEDIHASGNGSAMPGTDVFFSIATGGEDVQRRAI